MAGIRFRRLVEDLIDTLERSSATVIPLSVGETRPARIRVLSGNRSKECLIFLWKITPGGGPAGIRPENERRIQITNVPRIPLEPGVHTMLGGWSEEFGVYAFWDARRHTSFSQRSPSLQVNSNTLETANTVGIATQLRPTLEGQEVVVAVAPTSMLWYVQQGLPLHNSEEDSNAVVDLASATPEDEQEFLNTAASEMQSMRRHDLVQTMQAFRDAKFRPDVLHAYQYKCAVCSCDLKLVDAAHIVPVAHPQSTDDVTNGLALCRLHHGAYDNALLGVRSDLSVVINTSVLRRLKEIKLDTSFDEFKSRLPGKIRVPRSLEARPRPDRLKLGMTCRSWPQNLIG